MEGSAELLWQDMGHRALGSEPAIWLDRLKRGLLPNNHPGSFSLAPEPRRGRSAPVFGVLE
jgi:hypothetical protein